MRALTWNLNWRRRGPAAPQLELIERCAADVVLLQEVAGALVDQLRTVCRGDSSFSQELHPEATLRWMGCAVLLPAGGEICEHGLIWGLPKPQRGLWARVALPGGQELLAVSWHSPNAARDGRAVKEAAYAEMHRWLADAPRPLLLGADLNTWHDRVDPEEPPVDHLHREELAFLAFSARHGLVDVYRAVLAARSELERLRRSRPEGPLAVSYVLSSGAEHRMDRLYASPELTPVGAAYCYDAAIAAGSDHALHWADLAARGAAGSGRD